MPTAANINLIINADDYGYFPCVSQGILDAAKMGCITATGVLANSPNIEEQLQKLDTCAKLDLGVHLNLTYGTPLTATMQEQLARHGGLFPGLYDMMLLIVLGKIRLDTVRTEWRAQIDACRARKLMFLNSHEHIHMFPSLFKLTLELAREFGIPHIRLTRAEWSKSLTFKACIRNTLIQIMYRLNSYRYAIQSPILLGLGQSGKLDYAGLQKILTHLKSGNTYELMCHPGHFNLHEISDPMLQHYHAWEQEFTILTSLELQNLYQELGIRLCPYPNASPSLI